jgi:hypothetical protein
MLLDFITCTILGVEYRSWSSSLWSFLHSPVTSSIKNKKNQLYFKLPDSITQVGGFPCPCLTVPV